MMQLRTLPPASASAQRGVSLLEVLIAVVVLSIGLIGMAGLQMSALRNNQSAFDRSIAILHINSAADILRADINAVRTGPAVPTSTFIDNALKAWQERLAAQLPGAVGSIDQCETSTGSPPTTRCVVTITWDDSMGIEGSDEQSLVTEVQL